MANFALERIARVSLRRLISVLNVVLAALVLVSAAALVRLTTRQHQTVERMAGALQSIWSASLLEVDLLSYGRAAGIQLLAPEEGIRVPAPTRDELRSRLAEVRAQAGTPEDVRLVKEVEYRVQEFFLSREALERQGLRPAEVVRRSIASLDEAIAAAERLADHHAAQALSARLEGRRLDRLANLTGAAVLVVLAVGGATVALAIRRRIYEPFSSVRSAMARFSVGERAARAPAEGPEELKEISRTFNEAADRLERQLRAMASVAHDMRTPLSTLRAAAASLELERAAEPTERLRLAGLLRRQVDRLDRMTADLLDTAAIEAGEVALRTEEGDLRPAIAGVVAMFQELAPSHRLTLRLPERPLSVRFDPLRIEQVASNLVSNAIKYSPPGSQVDVTLEESEGEALLSVRDRGRGIPLEEQEAIFVPFRRSPSSGGTPGSGLGLSVSRRLVQAHGGTIELESEPKVGSTFRVRLPLLLPVEERLGPSPASVH